MSELLLENYIDGEWVASTGKKTVPITNPATEEILGRCPLGTADDVDRAVKAAHTAFLSWRHVPVVDRIQYLFKIKQVLEENLNELATLVTQEHGKTLVEARGSVRRGIQMVETATGMTTFQMGECLEDIAAGVDSRTIRKPIGVFGGIAPFNFPAMVPFWFWPFAVASGNTFVLKPSERVPLTQKRIMELIHTTGLPKGVMSLVHGGKDVVDALCTHEKVKGLCFVGSTPVARHVYQLGTQNGKRVQALGGAKNFMVVMPDAIMDKAVATALESVLGCAGERCLAGSVIVSIGDKTYEEVKKRILPLAADYSVGNGLDSKVKMGPVISQESKERILGLIQSGVDEGATLLLDGRKKETGKTGYFLHPSVLGDVKPGMRVATEEIFGPVALLAKVNSLDEAIEWINEGPLANTTTIFTSSGAAARKFCSEAEPAMIGVNIGVPAPMSFFSFGGAKDSFFGDIKAHGQGAVEFFTDKKTITERWLSDANVWAT